MPWKVLYFQTARGDYPVREFVDAQDKASKVKVKMSLNLLKNHGPFLKPPLIKKITKDIYELRIIGKTSIRIFFTPWGNDFYLLHGFVKKAQKTPAKEIKIAVARLKLLI